jgi:hypothetical protein
LDIYKIVKYCHKPERCIEWFLYSFFYLSASAHLAKELKRLQGDQTSLDARADRLLVPMIYNLRHGLELLQKALAFAASMEPPRVNDISKLFERVKEIFKDLDK